MTSEVYWQRLHQALRLSRLAPAVGGMALAADENGTHFLVYDPDALPEQDRAGKLAEILDDPAKFALGY